MTLWNCCCAAGISPTTTILLGASTRSGFILNSNSAGFVVVFVHPSRDPPLTSIARPLSLNRFGPFILFRFSTGSICSWYCLLPQLIQKLEMFLSLSLPLSTLFRRLFVSSSFLLRNAERGKTKVNQGWLVACLLAWLVECCYNAKVVPFLPQYTY